MSNPIENPGHEQSESNTDKACYVVFIDDNYDKSGSSQSVLGSYTSLEEAIQACKDIVSESVMGDYPPGYTGMDVYRSWRFGGTAAFIKGSDAFNDEKFALELAVAAYGSFDRDFHQAALCDRIRDASLTFKRIDDNNDCMGGGLSVRACRELAEEQALAALKQQALTLIDYRDKVMNDLEEYLQASPGNPYDGSGLVAALLREYMIPAITAHFETVEDAVNEEK